VTKSARAGTLKRPVNRRRVVADLPKSRCIETVDSTTARIPSFFLLNGQSSRDPNSQLARLAQQFVTQNRTRLLELDAHVEVAYDGTSVDLQVSTHAQIGAISLISPTSARSEFGLIVKPRFGWPGIGPILGASGWRVAPSLLSAPALPRSERKIPLWVLAAIVIFRMRALAQNLDRRFEMTSGERSAPRGSVDWEDYARRKVSRARMLEVPCRFPELQEDRDLKGAIRFTLEKQLGSLQGQRTAGTFVVDLIMLCQQLLDRVRDVPAIPPRASTLAIWMRGSLRTETFRRGVEAIEWTVEERGLAGLSDLQGLPWAMSMESFFEAWAETLIARVARRCGGVLKTGRRRETIVPLGWNPPYLGSQKSLVPDIVLERDDLTVIVDAKYKDHWEEMQEHRWLNLDEDLRERHRADLLQVLAYSTIARTPNVLVCLAYPCREETWRSLRDRGRLFHRATLPSAERRIDLLLTAFPLSTRVLEEVVGETAKQIAIV
jgi:McrBC 5-methylcytosine restriction system component